MEGRGPELPSVKPVEVKYPGFKTPLREVTVAPSDVTRVNKINSSLNPAEYAETGDETLAETLAWLKSGSTRKFSNIHPGTSKRNLVGIEQASDVTTSNMTVGLTNATGELTAYTYIYDHESIVADRLPKSEGTFRKEISFVSDLPDAQRSTEEISESMQQTAMMLWEIQAGKTISELSGSFTPDQLKEAQKLQIFTTAGDGPDETKYRDGLAQSGFKELGSYDEEGALQHVYGLDLDTLITAMASKKAASSQ